MRLSVERACFKGAFVQLREQNQGIPTENDTFFIVARGRKLRKHCRKMKIGTYINQVSNFSENQTALKNIHMKRSNNIFENIFQLFCPKIIQKINILLRVYK